MAQCNSAWRFAGPADRKRRRGDGTYTFIASSPGTHSYYSGTQGDLQIEMGLYGAIIVLPADVPAVLHQPACMLPTCTAEATWGEKDFRLAAAAYDHAKTCYDREYLFQFSEMDPQHPQPGAGAGNARTGLHGWSCRMQSQVPTEPYHPAYFMINGRSMPDDMDPNYAPRVSASALQRQSAHASRANRCCCASSARDAGSIRSTSTPTTSASWRATET